MSSRTLSPNFVNEEATPNRLKIRFCFDFMLVKVLDSGIVQARELFTYFVASQLHIITSTIGTVSTSRAPATWLILLLLRSHGRVEVARYLHEEED